MVHWGFLVLVGVLGVIIGLSLGICLRVFSTVIGAIESASRELGKSPPKELW
ncbi:MAG: hypothetical protein JRD89_16720 [Deltaproteobacteria bacterium]|nr:hypothetical protein [Deltaproteobacteria bacterium]